MTLHRAMYISGAVELAFGAGLIWGTDDPDGAVFWTGAVLGGLGVLAIWLGFLFARLRDPVEEEIDRWEADWSARWVPACPTHGEYLCPVRGPRCPETRERGA